MGKGHRDVLPSLRRRSVPGNTVPSLRGVFTPYLDGLAAVGAVWSSGSCLHLVLCPR